MSELTIRVPVERDDVIAELEKQLAAARRKIKRLENKQREADIEACRDKMVATWARTLVDEHFRQYPELWEAGYRD